jgi:TPR repeat protein
VKNQKKFRFHERSARLLLLLTVIHTVPVIWLTPVAGGTAPIIALLAFGFAGLFTFDSEGVALGLFALLPALIYVALAWGLSWMIAKVVFRLPKTARLSLLAVLVLVPLAAVHFPIYVLGGHSGSSNTAMIGLFNDYVTGAVALTYWISLHGILAAFYASQFFAEDSAWTRAGERWFNPILQFSAVVLVCTVAVTNYEEVVCRPLAELGNAHAQVCVAKSSRVQARYWYERAASDGNAEAIAWLIENTPNRQKRLTWLRKGAQAGEPAIQYLLAVHLRRYGTPADTAEADRWLEAAVAGNYGPAQMELAEQLTAKVVRTQSRELLAKRNGLLEQAAENGSRLAMLRLAQHYTRGSMGYPADFSRARSYYQVLAEGGELSKRETRLRISHATYAARLLELDTWQAGLDANDPQVTKEVAELYLKSPLPGPGVREAGMQMFERIAETDPSIRRELIVMLRTGTDGADKDLTRAKQWLLQAANAGETKAMERVASNYMDGREGFPLDYPQARHWLERLVDHHRADDRKDAQRSIAQLQNKLKYIDRLGEQAGGTLLGEADLVRLAQKTDAEGQYQFALQLLAGHGSKRRTEALEALQAAARLGSGDAAWRLVEIYERGFPRDINPVEARRELERAVEHRHFYATRELASRYEYGKKGFTQDLPKAIAMYEGALVAGHDNRYAWDLDPDNHRHYRWLESRLRQAKLKLTAQVASTTN